MLMGGGQSIFDDIRKDDLVLAFFPCIYFSCQSQIQLSFGCINYIKLSVREKTDVILKRVANREYFFSLLVKLYSICLDRGLRCVIENPYTQPSFLGNANFVAPPTIVDKNRTKRGDFFVKPTAYWFINFNPTNGQTYVPIEKSKIKKVSDCKRGKHAGLCREERSMISPLYAHNWICDFILGKDTKYTQTKLQWT